MKDEMDHQLGKQKWELTELPARKQALHNKCVYRLKTENDGNNMYKARLTVKVLQHNKGINYFMVCSPVVKITTIRLVLGIVAT